MYLIRLDDASEYMDVERWNKIEQILDKYNIKPIVGVIPNNQDESLIRKYKKEELFWNKVIEWQNKGWNIAMHGYNHVYITDKGGINPVNKRSEFAGVSYELQCEKIQKGYEILKSKGINTEIFFAPSHTFDENTIKALKEKSDIRIISDTIANNIYYKNDMYFIPQQTGRVRKLPFKLITFCYHPNIMIDKNYEVLEKFIKVNHKKFIKFDDIKLIKRKKNIYDELLNFIYFLIRKSKR